MRLAGGGIDDHPTMLPLLHNYCLKNDLNLLHLLPKNANMLIVACSLLQLDLVLV